MRDAPLNTRDWQVRAAQEGRLSMLVVPIPVHRFAGHLNGYSTTGRVKAYYGDHRLGLEFISDKLGLWHPEDNPDGPSAWYVPLPLIVGRSYWCREAWGFPEINDAATPGAIYRADGRTDVWPHWRSAQTMPRIRSRITIIPTAVRVCRVQDVTEDEAWATAPQAGLLTVVCLGLDGFRNLWITDRGPDAWERNPWVCIAAAEVHLCNIDRMPTAGRRTGSER